MRQQHDWRRPLKRGLTLATLGSATLLAGAQAPGQVKAVTAGSSPPARAVAPLMGSAAAPMQLSRMQPPSASDIPAQARARDAANAEAQAQAIRLSTQATAPLPPQCDRRTVAYGAMAAATTFALRPNQHVVLQGCFGHAPAGEVRVHGLGTAGFQTLHILDWKPNFVHARLGGIYGEKDKPIRLQLKFSDGSFSNALEGRFVAERVRYEVSGYGPIKEVAWVGLLEPKPQSPNAYSSWNQRWGGTVALPPGTGSTSLAISTFSPRRGGYRIGPVNGYRLLGYHATLMSGLSQFRQWGPKGELELDWATAEVGGRHLHHLIIDKLVVEAPVGTINGVQLPD